MPSAREKRMADSLSRSSLSGVDDHVNDISPGNIAELREALARERDPGKRRVLGEELTRILNFKGEVEQGGKFKFSEPAEVTAPTKGFKFSEPNRLDPTAPLPRPAPRPAPLPNVGQGAQMPTIGFAETPGGAATGLIKPRVAGDAEADPSFAGRLIAETGGAFAGAALGSRIPVPGATRVGEMAGTFAGSLLGEVFDPTEDPLKTAATAAAVTGAVGGAVSLGVAGVRKALGNPTAAGQRLLKIAEARGEVPLPGAVLDEGSLASKIEAIGRADSLTGHRITQKVQRAGEWATQDVSQYVNDYLRVKALANRKFEQWDSTVQGAFGSNRVVYLPKTSLDSIEPIIKIWESRGLAHQFDPTLLRAVQAIRSQVDAATSSGGKVSAIKLSMAEAEAVRTLFYENARARAGAAATDLSEIGGQDLARAYRKEAEVVGDHIDAAIAQGIKDSRLPAAARAELQGARDLWKRWKTGETLIDELAPKIESAARAGEPLDSGKIFSALDRISKMEEKFGKRLIDGTQRAYLSGIARAMKANEEAGKGGLFQMVVRGAQAGLVIGGGAAAGPAGLATGAAIALTPALMTFITTNKAAASLLMRGLRVDPGSEAALTIARQFTSLLVAEGLYPPQRAGEVAPATFGPAGVSGARINNPSPSNDRPGRGVRN